MRSERRGFVRRIPGRGECFQAFAKLLPDERRRIARAAGLFGWLGGILARGIRHGANRSNRLEVKPR